MRYIIIKAYTLFVILTLSSIISCMYIFAENSEDDLSLNSTCAVLIDADNGRILYGKSEDSPLPMASTTKIMTCIIALENSDINSVATASSYAASQPKVHLGVTNGMQFYLRDLLYSLMLESHNDSAVIIAENVAGSVEAFAELMNKKAREIGCTDTYFITPNGLDAVDSTSIHHTTATDLAKIMSYCAFSSPKSEEFLTITGTASYSFTEINNRGSYSCSNHNALLNSYECVISGKTGYTGNAGYCYTGAFVDGDRHYCIALLACGWPPHKTYKWQDAAKLISYGLNNYALKQIGVSHNFNDVKVLDGTKEYVSIALDTPDVELMLSDSDVIDIQYSIADSLTAPVKEGTIVGNALYYINNELYRTFDIYTTSSSAYADYAFFFREVFKTFFSLESFIILY